MFGSTAYSRLAPTHLRVRYIRLSSQCAWADMNIAALQSFSREQALKGLKLEASQHSRSMPAAR